MSTNTDTPFHTVAEWGPVREIAVAAKVSAEERIAEGDETAVSALDKALREIERIDREIVHARTLEKARAEAAKVNAAREARTELTSLDETIAARRPVEAEHGETCARAALAVEAAEASALEYFKESEKLLIRRSFLAAKAEGKTAGHNGLADADFRLRLAIERKRQELLPPDAAPTDFARWYGAPLWPRKREAPAPTKRAAVEKTINDGPRAAANGRQRVSK